MKKYLGLVLLMALGCQTTSAPPTTLTSSDYLPLKVDNRWQYLREKYYRGTLITSDTLTITVVRFDSVLKAWMVARVSSSGTDTISIQKEDDTHYRFLRSGLSVFLPLISISPTSAIAMLLPTKADGINSNQETSLISDSSFNSSVSKRLHQHYMLYNADSTTTLQLDFEHSFVRGVGQVYAKFVADINQCLVCSLRSEFYTYRLIDYTIQ